MSGASNDRGGALAKSTTGTAGYATPAQVRTGQAKRAQLIEAANIKGVAAACYFRKDLRIDSSRSAPDTGVGSGRTARKGCAHFRRARRSRCGTGPGGSNRRYTANTGYGRRAIAKIAQPDRRRRARRRAAKRRLPLRCLPAPRCRPRAGAAVPGRNNRDDGQRADAADRQYAQRMPARTSATLRSACQTTSGVHGAGTLECLPRIPLPRLRRDNQFVTF